MVAVTTMANAQNGINSPYSQFGIGLNNQPYNMPLFSSLGGASYTFSSNNTINPFNPASYASIGMESFIFDMGLYIEVTKLHNNDASQRDGDGNLGYLAFGLPLTKWWKTALGVMPLSDINYSSVYSSTGPFDIANKTTYEGYGGITQFFWGHAFNILGHGEQNKPQLRAGFNVNYLYGTLTRAITYSFPGNDTNYYMNSRKQKDTYIKNFTFDFGFQYDQPLGTNHRLSLGFTMKPHRLMDIRDNALVYTFITNAATEYMRDTVFPSTGNDSEYGSTLEQPLSLGFGISLQRNDIWRVAFDASLAPWSGMKYTENTNYNIFGNTPLRYDNTFHLALGMQLLGDKNATSYMRRVTYSAGMHYESGCLQLELADNSYHSLNEWGFGIGMSLPMRKGRSVLNLAISYFSLGTVDLLRRDIISFGISVGSCESWFVKRKFN